jgi:hypothetical protein
MRAILLILFWTPFTALADTSVSGWHVDPAQREPPCGAPPTAEQLAGMATAPFDEIAVQLDYQGTYVFSPPFARVPVFTLYRDGTLFRTKFSAKRQLETLMRAKLAPEEVERITSRVSALGFDRLESHLDHCSCPSMASGSPDPPTVRVCVSDAAYTILRVRSGELRHVVIYGRFVSDPQALQSIVKYLESYRAEGETAYVPDEATLMVSALERARRPCEAIDSRLLARPMSNPSRWAVALRGQQVHDYLARLRSNMGSGRFCQGSDLYQLSMFPWLPGADHTSMIAKYAR